MTLITLKQIDAILPQSQCQQCGYPSCLDYAKAILNHNETLDKCLFGGKDITQQLSNVVSRPLQNYQEIDAAPAMVALIEEMSCIGCVKCVDICPVDSIVGAKRQLHTVMVKDCTGCKLCIKVCPMNCIELIPRTLPPFSVEQARQHYYKKLQRLKKLQEPEPLLQNELTIANPPNTPHKKLVADAIARMKLKKSQTSLSNK